MTAHRTRLRGVRNIEFADQQDRLDFRLRNLARPKGKTRAGVTKPGPQPHTTNLTTVIVVRDRYSDPMS